MICPNCRAEIPDDSQACTTCGTPILHPRVVDAEIIPPDHAGQSDAQDTQYRHAPQGVHFSRVFYTTFPSREGIPPACLPTFISLGLALAAAFKYGILAAIGFLVFAGVGRLITFFLTVIFDLTVAIEVGLIIACVLFMKRVMETTEISVITDEIDPHKESDIAVNEENIMIPKGVEVYEINGPYFFGIATKFEETMAQLGDRPNVRIIRMRKVPFIDSTGIHNLTTLCEMSQKEKITVILSGVNEKVYKVLEKSGFYELLGKENICPNFKVALDRAEEVMK